VTVVTAVEAEHVEAFAALAEEMDRFYGATETEPLDLRLQQINDALFSNPPAAYALIAWDEDRPIGFATYSFLWPAAGLTRSLFLKELYVTQATRRTGIGELLMRNLAQVALKHGCSRLEWNTDQPNTQAQQFYAKLGVQVDESKLFYRAQGDTLRTLASEQ
jgi:GNAT superfamily N-acetyltransferase